MSQFRIPNFLFHLLALVFAGLSTPDASATKPSHFTATTWGMESGLPHPRVKALAQTEDGYLWAATPGGLARFDGQRFKVFDEKEHPLLRDVSALGSGRDNRLWLGIGAGAIVEFRDGRFRTVLPAGTPGLEGGIMILAEDRDGLLWITTGRFRVGILRNGSLEMISDRWKGDAGPVFQARCTRDKRVIVNSAVGLWDVDKDALQPIVR